MYMFYVAERSMQKRSDVITTGLIEGTQVPTRHRTLNLYFSWLWLVMAGIVYQVIMFVAWVLAARTMSNEDLRWLMYAAAAFTLCAPICWVLRAPIWYLDLMATLRQAEAD